MIGVQKVFYVILRTAALVIPECSRATMYFDKTLKMRVLKWVTDPT